MNGVTNRKQGSALLVVILLATAVVVGVGVAVKLVYEKSDRTKQEMHTRNLKEANKTVYRYVNRLIMETLPYDIPLGSSTAFADALKEIEANIRLRFPEAREIVLDPTKLLGVTMPGITTLFPPQRYRELGDPFRANIAREGSLSNLEYTLYIGYGDDADNDGYVEDNEGMVGYRVKYGPSYVARRISPENFAWGHYGTQQNPDWTANLFIRAPNYIADDSVNLEDQAKLLGNRSSSLLTLASGLTQGVEDMSLTRMELQAIYKPAFMGLETMPKGKLRPEWVLHPRTIHELADVVEGVTALNLLEDVQEMDSTEEMGGLSPYSPPQHTPPSAFSLTNAKVKSALKTEMRDVKERGEFVLFSDVEDSVLAQQNNPEAPMKDFWGTQYPLAWDGADPVFLPANAATLRVNVDVRDDGSSTVQVMKQPNGLRELSPLGVGEDFVLNLTPTLSVRPRDTGYHEYVEKFLSNDTEFFETYEVNPGYPKVDNIEGTGAVARLQEFIELEERSGDTVSHGDIIRQSFLNGAIRYQRIPNAGIYHHAVVVDMGRLPLAEADFPRNMAYPNVRGVFVDIAEDDLSLPARKTAVRNLLNTSMVLLASDLTEVQGPSASIVNPYYNQITGWEDGSDISASVPAGLLGDTLVFGTNGRVIFDTSVNLNSGTRVTQEGLLDVPSGSEVTVDTWSELGVYYGDHNGLAPAVASIESRNDTGGHRMVFASRLRPAVTYAAKLPDLPYALDPTVTTNQLLFDGFTYDGTNYSGEFANVTSSVVRVHRKDSPAVTPFNTYADQLLSGYGFSAPPGYPFQRVKDIPNTDGLDLLSELGTDPYETGNVESQIDGMLETYARRHLRDILKDPDYAAWAVSQRLASTDPALVSSQEEIYATLVRNLGRQESRNYLQVFFQHYGYTLDVDDGFNAETTYRFRPVFSGNIKQRVVRYCRTEDESTDFSPPTQEEVFKAAEQAKVVLETGEVVDMVFRNCPAEHLIDVGATVVLDPALNESITGNVYDMGDRSASFFYPVLDGPQGPESVEDLLRAFLLPNTTWDAALSSVDKLPLLTTDDYMRRIASSQTNLTVETQLVGHAQALLSHSAFSTKALGSAGDGWEALFGISPFYGRMQYTLAFSQAHDPAAISTSLGTAHHHQLKAYWTLEGPEDALRIVQVKVQEYEGNPITLSGANSETLAWDGLEEAEQETILEALDNEAFPAYEAYMDASLYDAAQAEAWVGHCISNFREDLTNADVEGGILGYIEFFLDATVDSLSYDVYMNEDFGHYAPLEGTSPINYNRYISSRLNILQSPDVFDGDVAVIESTKVFSPRYQISEDPTQTPQKVRDDVTVVRNREVFGARVFEPLTNGFTDPVTTNVVINSATGLGLGQLSPSIQMALFRRHLTFILFTDGATLNIPPTESLSPFAGVGTIYTAAQSPHPAIMTSVGLRRNSDTVPFGWTGSIKTGIGTEIDWSKHAALVGVDAGASVDMMRTYIAGDPLLTSREWGSIGYAEQISNTEAEQEFNTVTRSR